MPTGSAKIIFIETGDVPIEAHDISPAGHIVAVFPDYATSPSDAQMS